MKIAVVGAGAIGSIIGGLLSNVGEDVTLIGRKTHVDEINKNGLLIDGALGTLQIKVKAAVHLDFEPDIVFITVKTQDIGDVMNEIRSFVSNVPIVTMQNGVQSDILMTSVFAKENIYSCVILFAGMFLEPGRVSYSNISSKGSILIGSPYGASKDKLEIIAALLNKIIPTRIYNDISGAHWTKLLHNLNNSIQAVTGLPIQFVYNSPQVRILSIQLMKEGLSVLKFAGKKPISVPTISLFSMKFVEKMPLSIASIIVKMQMKSKGDSLFYCSTLQSIKRGKKTEIDYLNGEIVRLGKQLGVVTPYNSFILALVHEVEATGKFLTINELSEKYARVSFYSNL